MIISEIVKHLAGHVLQESMQKLLRKGTTEALSATGFVAHQGPVDPVMAARLQFSMDQTGRVLEHSYGYRPAPQSPESSPSPRF